MTLTAMDVVLIASIVILLGGGWRNRRPAAQVDDLRLKRLEVNLRRLLAQQGLDYQPTEEVCSLAATDPLTAVRHLQDQHGLSAAEARAILELVPR